MKLRFLIGLGGVSGVESRRKVHVLGDIFDALMVVIGILVLYQWDLMKEGTLSLDMNHAITWITWGFLLFKMAVMLTVVRKRFRYLSQNWMNIVILFLWIPLLINPHIWQLFYFIIRPIIGLCLFVPWFGIIRLSLMDGKLKTTILSLIFVVVISGILMTGIDPAFKNVGDGVWWAWVTMSTVGYGDYVPVSAAGRIVASAIILVGVCFFAILTANFSSLFIRRANKRERDAFVEEREKKEALMLERLTAIEEQLKKLNPNSKEDSI